MIVAIAAWDLRGAFGKRFELGLGSQVRGNIIRRYSERWTPPAPRILTKPDDLAELTPGAVAFVIPLLWERYEANLVVRMTSV